MNLADQGNGIAVEKKTKLAILRESVVAKALRGLKFGDTLTGAPGQPVESGELRDLIKVTVDTPALVVIEPTGEAVAWAFQNETGIALPGMGPYQQRSSVGGRWSFKRTAIGIGNLQAQAAEELGL